MFLKKNWLAMLLLFTVILVLGACGDKNEGTGNKDIGTGDKSVQADNKGVQPVDGESNYDNPRNHTAEDFMPISEGFEKYPVWIKTDETPNRNTYVNGVYVFEDGEVTAYKNFSDLNIEDIVSLSGKEVVQKVKDISNTVQKGKYTLDIILDEMGQNTQEMHVVTEDYTDKQTYDLQTLMDENDLTSKEEYIAILKEKGEDFEVKGEYITITTEEKDSVQLKITRGVVSQKIFETTYSGVKEGDDESILTMVDDSFVGFRFDSPDTDKKNVTIEGK